MLILPPYHPLASIHHLSLLLTMLPLLLLLNPVLALDISKEPSPCRPDILAVYKLTLSTNWNKESFPRQYPLWRPPAQWSKTLGFSHTEKFNLFSLGQGVSEGVKQFVETGDSQGLDSRGDNSSLLDSFTGPPILSGSGNSSARVFLDGRHTRVSLVTKLVPSPDWFIGLDSLDLCQGGRFIDALTMEVDPLDAGTDNGFTFTSPNWPTEPAGVAFRITSSYPPHPAGSFHYPHLPRLPSIATFKFVKEAEYSLSQQFEHVSGASRLRYSMEGAQAEQPVTFVPVSGARTKRKLAAATGPATLRKRFPSTRNMMAMESKDKSELYQTILRSYTGAARVRGRRRRLRGDRRQRRHKKEVKKEKGKQDCRVGEWGEWGACSKSCDIGETTRSRGMEAAAQRGGHACPPLTEMRWCGSGKNCKEDYFDW